jgi:hypothetical protein
MSQGGVSSPDIVEALDILEDRTPPRLTTRPRVAVDLFPLQGRHEALSYRVVVGIGHRSHRGQKTLLPNPTDVYWLPRSEW